MSDYTLEEIAASWLGHGKKIPVGKSMAWLIGEVERLHNQLVRAGEVERALMEQVARHKQEEPDECVECLRNTADRLSTKLNRAKEWIVIYMDEEHAKRAIAELGDWHD